MEKIRPTLFLKGMAMGIAEVIPGVSGGTIAFITGIYERLLRAISILLSPAWIRVWRDRGWRQAWYSIDGLFMVVLLGGMAAGLIGGVFGVTYLIEHYPPVVWAFFFGLIVASAIYIGLQVGRWTWREGVMLLIGIVSAYYLTVLSPLQGSDAYWAVFLSGSIAICALVLPGISGSFVLLLLGMYTLVLSSVRNMLSTLDGHSISIVVVFALGCLLGLSVFSRFLSWTLTHYRRPTLALLTGFMVGSVNKLWPWRKVLEFRVNSEGLPVPFREINVWPAEYEGEPYVVAVVIAIVLGIALVFILDRLGQEEVFEPEEEASRET